MNTANSCRKRCNHAYTHSHTLRSQQQHRGYTNTKRLEPILSRKRIIPVDIDFVRLLLHFVKFHRNKPRSWVNTAVYHGNKFDLEQLRRLLFKTGNDAYVPPLSIL